MSASLHDCSSEPDWQICGINTKSVKVSSHYGIVNKEMHTQLSCHDTVGDDQTGINKYINKLASSSDIILAVLLVTEL